MVESLSELSSLEEDEDDEKLMESGTRESESLEESELELVSELELELELDSELEGLEGAEESDGRPSLSS